jgi:hypothetical protein
MLQLAAVRATLCDAVSRTRYATIGYGDAHNGTTKEYHMREIAPKPANLRADRKPTDGYILTVDGKLKTRYETEKDATAEGAKLKRRFPALQIALYDASEGIYISVNAQEQ